MTTRDATGLASARVGSMDVLRVLATLYVAWFHFFGMAIETLSTTTKAESLQWLKGSPELVYWHAFCADFSIRIFIYISGFSLTLSALQRERFRVWPFYRSRLGRIYPAMWISLIVICATNLVWYSGTAGSLQEKLPVSFADLGWSAAGLTNLKWVHPVGGAWWFMGLILSLYLVYPLLFLFVRRGMGIPLLCVSFLLSICSDHVLLPGLTGIYTGSSVFVGSRLFEFSFGILLAEHYVSRGADSLRAWRKPSALLLLVACATGSLLYSRTLHFGQRGLAILCFLVFMALLALLEHLPRRLVDLCSKLAGPSLLFYLLHHNLEPLYLQGFMGAGLVWALPLFLLFALALWILSCLLQPVSDLLVRLVFGGRGSRPGPRRPGSATVPLECGG